MTPRLSNGVKVGIINGREKLSYLDGVEVMPMSNGICLMFAETGLKLTKMS